MNCPHCGRYAPEIDEFQAWCDECCAIDEIIVDDINAGHDGIEWDEEEEQVPYGRRTRNRY